MVLPLPRVRYGWVHALRALLLPLLLLPLSGRLLRAAAADCGSDCCTGPAASSRVACMRGGV
eukprot:9717644-Alexandrium_andersonii.AAC.1